MSDPKLKQQDFQNFYALAAVILFVLATVLAFLQPAGTHLRKSEESFWTRFFFPNERNIFLRIHNAATPHARIFGLADARRLWMVTGKYGFSSIDYGKNWVPDNLPSRKHWFNLENTGNWSAISDRGQRYTSQDDGRSWRPDKIPGSFPDLEAETKKAQKVGFNVGSIAFSGNGKYGVAIGGDGYFVQESRDTGLTWQLVAGAPNPLRDRNEYRQWLGAAALTHDGNSGIAVGTHGVFKILRTTPIGPWRPHTSKTGKQPVWSFNHSGETRDKLTDVALSEDGRFGIAVGVQSTILRSTDQGSSWKRIEPPWSWSETWPQGVTLRSVAMSRDGKTVLVAGGNLKGKGVVARSNDSGETWQPIGGTLSGTEIRSIKLAADGLTGFAVGGTPNTLRRKGNGTAGRIFVTRNGGETWSESRPDPAEGDPWPLLTSLFASADARVAIATTADGRLLISNDEGNRWSFSAGYSRTPAYWYYVAVVVSILLILHAVRPLVDPHASDLADHYESDAPVAKASADKLNFTPIAEAISHYLRNPNTTPPLNLAITAPWGTGKSSLMNLLAADLNRHEYRTVWFNAWHHQSEEHLLASLLEAIRVKAVPAWWEPDWLLFTGRLLWIRLTRDLKSPRILFWLMPVLIVMGVYLLGGQVGNIDAEAVNSLTILTAVPVLGLWIGKQARALSIDPAKLAAGIDRRISVKQFREHLGFRHKFNQEFSDVTSALKPSTIVIIIDDLDRCRPENLLEVLEAINFLMHSGRCFVVFGMDANPVLASLEISFEAVAKILAEHEDSGIHSARDYARNYLEKMINIEVPVPPLGSHAAELFKPHSKPKETGSEGRWNRLKGPARRLSMAFFFLVGLAGSTSLLTWLLVHNTSVLWPVVEKAISSETQTASDRRDGNGESYQGKPIIVSDVEQEYDIPKGVSDDELPPVFDETPIALPKQDMVQGLTNIGPWTWLVPLSVISLLVTMLGTFGRWRSSVSQDSDELIRAMKHWSPLLSVAESTPRNVKRFHNRLRFLSMLQNTIENARRIPETLLVALGILKHQADKVQDGEVDIADLFDDTGRLDKEKAAAIFDNLPSEILEELESATDGDGVLRPSPRQLDTFSRLSSGAVIR